jgi:hypothetical protein
MNFLQSKISELTLFITMPLQITSLVLNHPKKVIMWPSNAIYISCA